MAVLGNWYGEIKIKQKESRHFAGGGFPMLCFLLFRRSGFFYLSWKLLNICGLFG
jgi:hypothetical protein